MPHIVIKCYPGRSQEQKKKCADKVAAAIVDTMGCDLSHVSVAIQEISQEEWKEKVWDHEIGPKEKDLYIKPGYTCE
ncbi:MAG TPA: tautomerase family protein [Bacillota bacterium]|nr:tautomerase family protein [Bacillota bacterium]